MQPFRVLTYTNREPMRKLKDDYKILNKKKNAENIKKYGQESGEQKRKSSN